MTSSHPRIALAVASLAFFLISLDILIVNVALSDIRSELGGGTAGQQWVIDGYTLLFASLLLLSGNLSDRFGARRIFAIGVGAFLLASIICALAPTLDTLIGARLVQGATAALVLPASTTLVREAFPDSRARARALGVWAVGGAIAGAVGPLLGGALTAIDWRLVFVINIPICAAMLVLLSRVARSPARPATFDVPGQIAAVVGLAALTWGLIEGGDSGFGWPAVIAALVLAAAALSAFVLIEKRVPDPMMPPALFRSVNVRIAVSVGFAFIFAWFGTVFLMSLYLQQHLGLPPALAGLAFLPAALFSFAGNITSGRMAARFGARLPMLIGQGVLVVGLTSLAVTVPLGSPVLTAFLLILVGPGGSLAVPAATSLLLDSVPADRAGAASAVFNTFRQVGGAVGIAVFGALIADPSTFVRGMQASLTVAACILLVTGITTLRVVSRAPQPQAD